MSYSSNSEELNPRYDLSEVLTEDYESEVLTEDYDHATIITTSSGGARQL